MSHPRPCKVFNLVDTGADKDHMLLTPSAGDSDLFLTYKKTHFGRNPHRQAIINTEPL